MWKATHQNIWIKTVLYYTQKPNDDDILLTFSQNGVDLEDASEVKVEEIIPEF